MAKNRVQVEGVSAPTLKNSIGGLGQTFVSPEANPRGAQIAAALQGVAPVVQQKVNEYQEDVRYVDGLKAKNAYGVLAPSLKEHMSNADYSIKEQADGTIRRLTADEHFASWAQADQYEEMRKGLGSLTAQRALEESIGQAVADGYGTGSVIYDQEELRGVLHQSLELDLVNGVPNAVEIFDQGLQQGNKFSPQEAMEELRDAAAHQLRTTGNSEVFDYIEKKGMGSPKWQDATNRLRESVANEVAVKNDNDRRRMLNARTDTKAELMVEAAKRLNKDPYADLDDLNAQALEAGISDFKGSSGVLRKTYNPSSSGTYTMSVADKTTLQRRLTALPTRAQQLQFIEENSDVIDSSTASTWLGWINSGSIPNFYDNDVYKAAMKTLDQRIEFSQGSNENVFKIKEHVDDTMSQVVQGERWKKAEEDGDIGEMMVIMQDVVSAATQLANAGAELSYTTSGREAEENAERQAAADKEAEAKRKRLADLEKQLNK